MILEAIVEAVIGRKCFPLHQSMGFNVAVHVRGISTERDVYTWLCDPPPLDHFLYLDLELLS